MGIQFPWLLPSPHPSHPSCTSKASRDGHPRAQGHPRGYLSSTGAGDTIPERDPLEADLWEREWQVGSGGSTGPLEHNSSSPGIRLLGSSPCLQTVTASKTGSAALPDTEQWDGFRE